MRPTLPHASRGRLDANGNEIITPSAPTRVARRKELLSVTRRERHVFHCVGGFSLEDGQEVTSPLARRTNGFGKIALVMQHALG